MSYVSGAADGDGKIYLHGVITGSSTAGSEIEHSWLAQGPSMAFVAMARQTGAAQHLSAGKSSPA